MFAEYRDMLPKTPDPVRDEIDRLEKEHIQFVEDHPDIAAYMDFPWYKKIAAKFVNAYCVFRCPWKIKGFIQ